LLTDGAESCDGDPAGAAAALLAGISGKSVQTYVIGFSVLPSEQGGLNAIAAAGGTGGAFFVSTKEDLANALAQIIGENQKFELCNDLDDDCDTLVDEDFPEKGLPCTDGELGVCLGIGTLVCTLDGSGTECEITNPGAMPGTEICNQLDDDCDGMIDEDDLGLPLPCPNCVPTLEVCDGVDNDCDLAIDEQGDVTANQRSKTKSHAKSLTNAMPVRAGVAVYNRPTTIAWSHEQFACGLKTECVRRNRALLRDELVPAGECQTTTASRNVRR
jgi:hypothetical protein